MTPRFLRGPSRSDQSNFGWLLKRRFQISELGAASANPWWNPSSSLLAWHGDTPWEGFCGKSVEKRWLCPEYNQRNLLYVLAPRKRACLASVPVAEEAAGGGERTMGGDCSAEGGTREGRVSVPSVPLTR
eukprot:scaffold114644_cov30-Phaeocystis_antarctica.AAC.3